jgi:hypothetical protein
MKKLLILLLLISFGAEAQYSSRSRDRRLKGTTQKAVSFDGATQYLSKATPASMDLNGSERLANTGFETDTSNWTVANGAIVGSTAQKKSGSRSCLLVATGAGASITSETVTDATTNKGTGETWVYCGLAASTKSIKIVLLNQALASIDSTITTVTGATWTKLVRNQQWSGTQTGVKVRIGFNGGALNDSLWIDDVSLTQAYDAMVYFNIKHSSTTVGASERFFYANNGTTNERYFCIATPTGVNIGMFDNAGGAQGSYSVTTFNDNLFHRIVGTYNRTGNVASYYDGLAGGAESIAGIGKITGISNLPIGSAGASNYFNGAISEVQIVRFTALPSDIATIVAGISATKKPLSSYTNGTIVGWWDFKNGFNDKVGLNNLTPTGAPPIIQVKY